MKTIISFANFIFSLFNTTLSIFIFCLVDEIEYKPEKSIELSDVMKTFYPVELILHTWITISAFAQGNWIQLLLTLPMLVYNIKLFLSGKYKIYYSIGEVKKDYSEFSMIYKIKFLNYLLLALACLIKFIIAITDMLSYRVFGETNLFINLIKLIGIY